MTADLQPLDRHASEGVGAPREPSVGSGIAGAAPHAAISSPIGWPETLVAAALVVRDRPALIAVGLLGFLARGGLVLFLLPIVALPTPIGISTFIGGTALTGAGASEGLIRLIAVAVVLVVLAVVGGAALGAVADALLARESVAFRIARERGIVTEHGRTVLEREARRALPVTATLMSQLFAIRVAALVPVAAATAWAASRLVAAGYHQLILPDDLSVPLGVRILSEASGAAAMVVAVWLASELVGGIAVRHVLVNRRSVPVALLVTFADIVRRPLTTLSGYVVGVVGVVLVAGPTLLIASLMWSRLQSLLADDGSIILLLPATVLFVLVWAGGLALLGAVVTWRSIAGSIDVLRVRRAPAGSTLAALLESPVIAMPRAGAALEDL